MQPMLADAINFGFVFAWGAAVLVPLLVFDVLVEGFILSRLWHVRFSEVWRFTLKINVWSLVAGIPVKVLNSYLYDGLLPKDIPGYLKIYPLAIALGTLIYFVVTLLVEFSLALRLRTSTLPGFTRGTIWKGILLANIATYAIAAPLHYFATRPHTSADQFTASVEWTKNPAARVLFVEGQNNTLQSTSVDGTVKETIVPLPVKDYLVSTNLEHALFRGSDNNLYLYQRHPASTNLVWKTKEQFRMNQVAFSPSAMQVGFVSKEEHSICIVDVATGERRQHPMTGNLYQCSMAWSTNESVCFLHLDDTNYMLTINGTNELKLAQASNPAAVFHPCYGRAANDFRTYGGGWWGGGDDWGTSYSTDECGEYSVLAVTGFTADLRFLKNTEPTQRFYWRIAVDPGWLHFSTFYFHDAAFLENGCECVFDANGTLYLADVHAKRAGKIASGAKFIVMTARYLKRL